MAPTYLALVLATAFGANTIESGTQLTYRGMMVADKGNPEVTRKTLEMSVLVAGVNEDGASLHWTIAEEGRGEWSWADHFGSTEVNFVWQAKAGSLPSMMYQRDGGKSVVPVVLPMLAVENGELAKGLRWIESGLIYNVVEAGRAAGYDAWKVDVQNRLGHKRTLWVSKNSPLVVAVNETVFIGQGEEFELQFELVDKKQLTEKELESTLDGFRALNGLRELLKHKPQSLETVWADEQLATLREELPAVADKIKIGPLVRVAEAATKDAKTQKGRSGAIAELRDKVVGSKIEKLALKDIKENAFDSDSLKDRVTILHFWKYRDAPLEEPYGQVAYLDFLYRQRQKDGVDVYGVCVDARLADPSQRGKAITSAKKLKSFMNLSYPLLLDSGSTIERLGDPRGSGAKLPLVVVIGRDGKVVHYHVGNYEVHRVRGLEELDGVVTKALGKAE